MSASTDLWEPWRSNPQGDPVKHQVSDSSLWRSFGEFTIVFHQTPDDTRQFMRNSDHRVAVAFVCVAFEDAIEVVMLFADRDCRHVHRPTQERRATLADGGTAFNAVAGLVLTGVETNGTSASCVSLYVEF